MNSTSKTSSMPNYLSSSRGVISQFKRAVNAFIANTPPPLKQKHSRSEYLKFMKQELFQYSPAYARGRVLVRGWDNLSTALNNSSVILGLLHHGSWILIGGVLRYVFGVPYNVVASRLNFSVMPPEEVQYWEAAHRFISEYYGHQLFYSDQPPLPLFRWLKQKSTILGVAFDVRENQREHRESEISFSGQSIWVQTNQAKLARLTKSVIIPAGIHYLPERKMHELEFYDAIDPNEYASDIDVTQMLFTSLEGHYMSYESQGFNDLRTLFSLPHSIK